MILTDRLPARRIVKVAALAAVIGLASFQPRASAEAAIVPQIPGLTQIDTRGPIPVPQPERGAETNTTVRTNESATGQGPITVFDRSTPNNTPTNQENPTGEPQGVPPFFLPEYIGEPLLY